MQKNIRHRGEIVLMIAISLLCSFVVVFVHDRYIGSNHISEKQSAESRPEHKQENDMLESQIDNFFQKELLSMMESHQAASQGTDYFEKAKEMCQSFASLCQKIQIQKNILDTQKYYVYQAIPIFLIHYMDKHGLFTYPIEEALVNINIVSQKGLRGYANNAYITMNVGDIGSVREYMEIMTHEMAHIIDLGAIVGSHHAKDKKYTEFGRQVFSIDDPSLDYYRISWLNEKTRRGGQNRYDFCSGYGQQDPFEDFAECVNLYMNHHDLFKHIVKRSRELSKKYDYIKKIFDGFYLYRDTQSIKKYPNPEKFTVFDSSKIR